MYISRRFAVLVVLAAAFFVYASYQPRYRLSQEMPSEFVDVAGSASTQGKAEEAIARAYWECMVTDVQWKYVYGGVLPHEPPAEFVVAVPRLGSAASAPATRARYWRKVQHVWFLPNAWSKEYAWDTVWVSETAKSAGNWLYARMGRVNALPDQPRGAIADH
jgi:hypothetical protein